MTDQGPEEDRVMEAENEIDKKESHVMMVNIDKMVRHKRCMNTIWDLQMNKHRVSYLLPLEKPKTGWRKVKPPFKNHTTQQLPLILKSDVSVMHIRFPILFQSHFSFLLTGKEVLYLILFQSHLFIK